jgi:hypothetical protein
MRLSRLVTYLEDERPHDISFDNVGGCTRYPDRDLTAKHREQYLRKKMPYKLRESDLETDENNEDSRHIKWSNRTRELTLAVPRAPLNESELRSPQD